MITETGIWTGIGIGHRDWDLDSRDRGRAPRLGSGRGPSPRSAASACARVGVAAPRAPVGCAYRGSTEHGEGDEEVRCPAASAAPVEPEEGEEPSGLAISISFLKNRGRLGALHGALDGWVAGSPQPFPFPAAVPGQLGLSHPVGRELLRTGGCTHGVSCTWGLHPRAAVWPPGTLRTGEMLGVPKLLHLKALTVSLPACCEQVRHRTEYHFL